LERLKEGAKFFKENEGYTRLFKAIKNKYIGLGDIKGNVTITKPTNIEKQAISGLMKKDYSKNNTITINLRKLQEAIDKSRFEGITILELLQEYFKEEIITKKESKQKYKNELERFWKDILKQNQNTDIYNYLEKSFKNQDELYQNIKKHYNKQEQNLKQELLNACKGINNLPKEITRIPVFASNVLSNPHGFDKKTLCGKLFILLLCYINNISYPKNNEELSELYYKSKLLVDDISNMVLCKNITGFTKIDEYKENGGSCTRYGKHEGLEGFYKYDEPIFLTLYNLSNINFINEYNKYKKVVITENPAVFMAIMENCTIKDFPLICTYGQVKLAGIILLDKLVQKGYKLYYSGDLDPEGIQIADKLKQRYKQSLQLLGFDKKVYYKNVSNIELSNSRLQKLEKVQAKELNEICKEIKKNKKAAYEEMNIDYIVRFIEKQ